MKGLPELLAAALLFWAAQSHAVIETYEFSDPALEERYQELSAELRCPKCQNQNIAASNAPISKDLRRQLHQQLEAGASDEEILAYMVDRYGEFVRYRPRFAGATVVLWLAPLLLLAAGGVLVFLVLRSRKGGGEAPATLDEDERRRVAALLNGEDRGT